MIRAMRLPESRGGEFPPGYDENIYCYWHLFDYGWLLNIPDAGLASLVKHTVVEHEDGTITVSPSIALYSNVHNDVRVEEYMAAHGHLERGVWRDC